MVDLLTYLVGAVVIGTSCSLSEEDESEETGELAPFCSPPKPISPSEKLASHPVLNHSGNTLAYSLWNETTRKAEIHLYDTTSQTLSQIITPENPYSFVETIAAEGGRLLYTSFETETLLRGSVHLFDEGGVHEAVSEGNCRNAVLSSDGTRAAFTCREFVEDAARNVTYQMEIDSEGLPQEPRVFETNGAEVEPTAWSEEGLKIYGNSRDAFLLVGFMPGANPNSLSNVFRLGSEDEALLVSTDSNGLARPFASGDAVLYGGELAYVTTWGIDESGNLVAENANVDRWVHGVVWGSLEETGRMAPTEEKYVMEDVVSERGVFLRTHLQISSAAMLYRIPQSSLAAQNNEEAYLFFRDDPNFESRFYLGEGRTQAVIAAENGWISFVGGDDRVYLMECDLF